MFFVFCDLENRIRFSILNLNPPPPSKKIYKTLPKCVRGFVIQISNRLH